MHSLFRLGENLVPKSSSEGTKGQQEESRWRHLFRSGVRKLTKFRSLFEISYGKMNRAV